jgi:hypothetical protein
MTLALALVRDRPTSVRVPLRRRLLFAFPAIDELEDEPAAVLAIVCDSCGEVEKRVVATGRRRAS